MPIVRSDSSLNATAGLWVDVLKKRRLPKALESVILAWGSTTMIRQTLEGYLVQSVSKAIDAVNMLVDKLIEEWINDVCNSSLMIFTQSPRSSTMRDLTDSIVKNNVSIMRRASMRSETSYLTNTGLLITTTESSYHNPLEATLEYVCPFSSFIDFVIMVKKPDIPSLKQALLRNATDEEYARYLELWVDRSFFYTSRHSLSEWFKTTLYDEYLFSGVPVYIHNNLSKTLLVDKFAMKNVYGISGDDLATASASGLLTRMKSSTVITSLQSLRGL